MRSKVSLVNLTLILTLYKEASQDVYEVLLSLFIMTLLNLNQMLYSAPVILQHSIDQQQCISNQLLVWLSFFHDFEEQLEEILGFTFLHGVTAWKNVTSEKYFL